MTCRNDFTCEKVLDKAALQLAKLDAVTLHEKKKKRQKRGKKEAKRGKSLFCLFSVVHFSDNFLSSSDYKPAFAAEMLILY